MNDPIPIPDLSIYSMRLGGGSGSVSFRGEISRLHLYNSGANLYQSIKNFMLLFSEFI